MTRPAQFPKIHPMPPDQAAIAQRGLADARAYATGVISGEIIACRWVKLAVERDERDRATAHERGLYFDEYSAARVLVFVSYLSHYKGEWRGKRVELEPWQSWIVTVVFGWLRTNGKRRFRQVYEEVARKNGKTIKLAGIGGYGLLKDREGAPEIYAAATTREQAKRLWKDARKMLGYSKHIAKKIKIRDSESHIECISNDGIFIPLSRESEAIDGANPHFALVDELHAHKTREIHDVLVSGQGARSQPLLWEITTAGFTNNKEASICLEQREYTCRILEGTYTDDEHFGVIYTLDDWENEWKDPTMWGKANPNIEYQRGTDAAGMPKMRGSVKYDYLQGQVVKAINSPVARVGVLTKNFSVWLSSAVSWLNTDLWAQCGDTYTLADLEGAEQIYAGLDLASVSDLCSIALLAIMPDGTERVWQRSYVPQDQVDNAIKNRNVPYDQWIRDGWLIATPGNVTDYEYIIADLLGDEWQSAIANESGILFHLPKLTAIGIDRWNSGWIVNKLMEFGLPLVGYGMGYQSMSPAMRALEHDYQGGKLRHPNDPLLTWAMQNVVATLDPSLNVKPDKKSSPEKIDPAVALIIAKGVSISASAPEDATPQIFVF